MKTKFALARTVVSPLFISGGLDALRNPVTMAPAAETAVKRLAKMGLPTDAMSLVRMKGWPGIASGMKRIHSFAQPRRFSS
jgi:hypothetical protein